MQVFTKKCPSIESACREEAGLLALKNTNTIKIPQIISRQDNVLKLEHIQHHLKSKKFFQTLAEDLSKLHSKKHTHLGFNEDNFIGLNPQKNTPLINDTKGREHPEFFWEYRIFYQLNLAEKNNLAISFDKEKLKSKVISILKTSIEPPSLLHGDMWSGNVLCGPRDQPYLIDPAVYFGHFEADLAMTGLFGGFSNVFYETYFKLRPVKADYEKRKKVFDLYHVLNHANLFYGTYTQQAYKLILEILSFKI